MKNFMKNMMRNLKEERGSSELITVVALIVVVLAAALIFRTQLMNIVTQIGAKVTSWISTY